jgi:hypothetical protein
MTPFPALRSPRRVPLVLSVALVAIAVAGGGACATSGSSGLPPGGSEEAGGASSSGIGNGSGNGASSGGGSNGSSGASSGSSGASTGSSGGGNGSGGADASPEAGADAGPEAASGSCIPGATARVHDDFESGSLGQWTITDRDFNPFMGAQTTVTLDTMRAHSASHAVKIASGGNGGLLSKAPPAQQFYGRAWVFMDADPGMGHWEGILGVGPARNDGGTTPEQLRLGGQFDILYMNASQTDGYFLSNPNFFTDHIGPPPPISKWVCEEFFFGDQTVRWWITDQGMTPSSMPIIDIQPSSSWSQGKPPAPWSPAYNSIALGYGTFGAASVNVWYDDIALDTSRICCDP